MPLPGDHGLRLARARVALEGLSVGDAFGERFFGPPRWFEERVRDRWVSPPPWPTTDDTEMALAVFDVLERFGEVDCDRLASGFARRYRIDPARGYGAGAHDLLERIGAGESWERAAASLFGGRGSYGNGGAMRVAPIGAYFADDPARVAEEARRSATVTHAHPEGQDGAVAVALAAAAAWRGDDLFAAALGGIERGLVRRNVEEAAALPPGTEVVDAAERLGNGSRVSAQDTVGFCLWCAARHARDYEEALWTTISVGGDLDTTAAIVGGIVVMAVGLEGIPVAWREAREPLRIGI